MQIVWMEFPNFLAKASSIHIHWLTPNPAYAFKQNWNCDNTIIMWTNFLSSKNVSLIQQRREKLHGENRELIKKTKCTKRSAQFMLKNEWNYIVMRKMIWLAMKNSIIMHNNCFPLAIHSRLGDTKNVKEKKTDVNITKSLITAMG